MDYVKDKAQVIVINDNYKMAPWASILYFCDAQWYSWHKDISFDGRIITQDKATADKYDLEYIESRAEDGLSKDTSYINQGQNSGFQAINLAYNLGAERVILLGYDMSGSTHWFGQHPNNQNHSFLKFAKAFSRIDQKLLEVINCSRNTALKCFPMQDLKDTL